MHLGRLAMIVAAPLLLVSCLVPGAFTSTLDIHRDRSFTYTYVGEVYALAEGDARPAATGDEKPAADPGEAAETKARQEAKRRAAADALAKEQGYKSVRYLGDGKFLVDYAISGTLDRGFVFPFNSDAEAIVPWIAIEVRADGTARIKAPGFGDEGSGAPSFPGFGGEGPQSRREGRFTLTTDAEIVMHNVEAGAGSAAVKTLTWQVTPTSRTVPTAVLRFAR